MTHSYRAVLFTITLSVFVSVSSVPSFALTGDVDPINKTPECISLVNNIRYGDSDAVTKGPITKLQTFLIDEGYMKGEATGYFGAVTFASVKRYQTARGLTDSGYVGEYTRAAVKADTCAEVTKPAPVVQQQATTSAAVFGPTSPTSTSAPAVTGGAVFGGSATYVPTVPFQSPVASIDRVNFPCVILLGKNSCTSEVTWSSNWFAPFPQSPELRTCELTSAGSCAAKEETYRGSSGTQSFTLQGGVRRIFSIWGYDFLGKIYKAYEVTTKGACASGSSWSGSACVTGGASFGGSATVSGSGGATFGPGYGSQPTTYGWVAYAGSMLGGQSPENLGWGSPSVACTSSNIGASYYLGVSSSGSQVVATCAASTQAITDFAPVTPSTLNTEGQTSGGTSQGQTSSTGGAVFGGSATVTCTESRGTFTNSVGQLIEWSCGCANPPAGGAWVSVGGSCFHQVVQ